MATPHKHQCVYKQIDWFQTPDGTEVIVTLLANKHSVKQYCTDTELPYKIGLRNLYEQELQRMQQRDLNEIYSERLKQ